MWIRFVSQVSWNKLPTVFLTKFQPEIKHFLVLVNFSRLNYALEQTAVEWIPKQSGFSGRDHFCPIRTLGVDDFGYYCDMMIGRGCMKKFLPLQTGNVKKGKKIKVRKSQKRIAFEIFWPLIPEDNDWFS